VKLRTIGMLLLALAAAACSEAPVDGTWHEERGYRWQLLQRARGGAPGLRELTARERLVFELRHYQGMRLRAIGEALGTTEEAAKTCLFRPTQKMRVALGDFV